MKKFKSKIFIASLFLLVAGVVLTPHVAFAQNIIESFALSGVNSLIAGIGNFFLGFFSYLVTVTGVFLSVSINVTLHIKDLYATVPTIQTVWVTIRDLSSIFIIFSLLYYSIRTILGIGGNNLNKLIINIFIAGLLINFSLFFVRVAVDASNLVSLQFYNAVAPNGVAAMSVGKVFTDGGLSDVFMQSLRIPTIYSNTSVLKTNNIPVSISIAALGGVLVMITASMSFLAAGVAFTARTAIIIFVMAISPIYFAGLIFPKIKQKVSDPILDIFKNQLIFMPVYLFLLYVALKIISDPNFMAIFNQTPANGSIGGALGPLWIGILIQYTIAMVFINAPLVAGIALGGYGMKWAPNAKDISKRVGGFFGRTFVGRPTKWAGEQFDSVASKTQGVGGKWGGKLYTATGLRKVSQGARHLLKVGEESKYGAPKNLEGYSKEDKERTKFVAGVGRHNVQEKIISSILNNEKRTVPPTEDEMKKFRNTVSGMDVKEMQEMDMDDMKKANFITAIPSGKFDSLLKDMSPNDQQELRDAREDAFKEMTDKVGGANFLLTKVLKGKPSEIAKLPTDVLKKPAVAQMLDAATLKKMIDENVGGEHRDVIRQIIIDHRNALRTAGTPIPHTLEKAAGYLESAPGGIF